MRIVSLLPSATDIVYTLGPRDHLVGRTHECAWPPDVESVPVMASARTATVGDTLEHVRLIGEFTGTDDLASEVARDADGCIRRMLCPIGVPAPAVVGRSIGFLRTDSQCGTAGALQVVKPTPSEHRGRRELLRNQLAGWGGFIVLALVGIDSARLDGSSVLIRGSCGT